MSYTKFMNVDLEIGAKLTPKILGDELRGKKHVTELYRGPLNKLRHVHFETAVDEATPEAAIRALLKLVENLSPEAQREWDNAAVRDFSIGIQAGTTDPIYEQAISADTIQRVADVGARITFAVYPSDLAIPEPRRSKAKKKKKK
jgi:hypothetical protein